MKYYIKQKIFSLRDKFSILDEQQNDVYHVEGKMFSLRNKLTLLDTRNEEVLSAQKQLFKLFPRYTIFSPNGEELAVVQKKFGIRPKFIVQAGHEELQVEGSLFGHSFGVFDGNNEVASISKKIISWGDTYEIEVHNDTRPELFLFIVIIIDQVIHEEQGKNNG